MPNPGTCNEESMLLPTSTVAAEQEAEAAAIPAEFSKVVVLLPLVVLAVLHQLIPAASNSSAMMST